MVFVFAVAWWTQDFNLFFANGDDLCGRSVVYLRGLRCVLLVTIVRVERVRVHSFRETHAYNISTYNICVFLSQVYIVLLLCPRGQNECCTCQL